jgi:hypothetical protein
LLGEVNGEDEETPEEKRRRLLAEIRTIVREFDEGLYKAQGPAHRNLFLTFRPEV